MAEITRILSEYRSPRDPAYRPFVQEELYLPFTMQEVGAVSSVSGSVSDLGYTRGFEEYGQGELEEEELFEGDKDEEGEE